jgi:hypothetical protein
VDRLSAAYERQVKFVELDAEGNGKRAFQAGRLPGHPSFVVMLPNGQEIWRGFGLVNEADLEAAIRTALEES